MIEYFKSLLRKPDQLILDNRKIFDDFDQSKALAEYDFVVVDTELTGLDRKADEIISIGAVRIRDLQIDLSSVYHRYVKPLNLDPTEATLVHRITPEQLRNAPTIDEVLPEFIEFVGSSLLVGHYVGLDMSFLNKDCRKFLGGTLCNPGIDTMRMAQGYKRMLLGHYHDMDGTSNSYRLEDLGKEFNLPHFEPHDALEDAMQTAYLFLFLIKKLKKGGLEKLKDLYQAGKTGRWN
ncbi:MAG: 3'-5' exonuclease [Desulfotalea sp.]